MCNIELLLFEKTIEIMNCIARKDYNLLSNDGCLMKMKKNDITQILEEYGGDLSIVDIKKYKGRFKYIKCKKKTSYITFADLIIDCNVSDLTLVCEIGFNKSFDYIKNVVIEDLHVL